MNFKIIRMNEKNRTMVIDWGNGVVLNHYIPEQLLNNENISKEEAIEVIEMMRPEESRNEYVVSSTLLNLYKDSNSNSYNNTANDEDVI